VKLILGADLHASNALPYARVGSDGVTTDRLADVLAVLEQGFEAAAEVGAEGLVILGDLFDRRSVDAPTLHGVAKVAGKWYADEALALYVLPGNHDLWDGEGRLYTTDVFHVIGDAIRPLTRGRVDWITDREVLALPHVPDGRARKILRKWSKEHPGAVVLIHQSVTGCVDGAWTCTAGLDADAAFDGFEIVLSGHFHDPQRFDRGQYLGAVCQHHFGDTGSRRGWYLWDTEKPAPRFLVESEVPRFAVHRVDGETIADTLAALDDRAGAAGEQYVEIRGEAEPDLAVEWRRLVDEAAASTEFCRMVRHRIEVIQETKTRAEVSHGMKLGDMIGPYVDAVADEDGAARLVALGRRLLDEASGDTVEAAGYTEPIEFLELTGRNFGAFGDDTVTLPLLNRGLVLITGENRDTTGADSNGSGKTTILRLLFWVLFGKTIEGMDLADVIHRGARKAEGTLTLRLPTNEVVEITRTRTAKSGRLSLRRDGAETKGRGAKETQAEIERLIGLDAVAFRNTILFGQGDTARFAAPGTTDGERKAIAARVLRLERLAGAADLARKERKERRAELAEVEEQGREAMADIRALAVERAEARLTEAEANLDATLAALDRDAGDWREQLTTLEGKRARRDKIAALLPRVDETIAKFDAAVEEHEQALADVDRLSHDTQERATRIAALQAEARLFDERLADLAGDRCPTCNSPTDEGDAAEFRAELERERTIRLDNVGEIRGEVEDLDRAKVAARNRVALAEGRLADRVKWTTKRRDLAYELRGLDGVDDELERAAGYLARLDERKTEARAAVDRLRAEARSRKAEAGKLSKRVADLTERAEGFKADLADLEWWVEGFGSRGLPSYVLDSIAPAIADRANVYLETLADGDIQVEIDTETILATGEARDVLQIIPIVEGASGLWPSGGQQRKIELAVDLALTDLVAEREGCAIDLLALDEAFDGLDSAGCARVVRLLRDLRERRATLLVIAHEAELKEHFDARWNTVKEQGVATVTL